MSEKIYPIAVIGGGAAGTMAALRCVLNNDETLFFSGSSDNKKMGRSSLASRLEKIPGYLQFQTDRRALYGESVEFIKNGPFAEKLHHVEDCSITNIIKNADDIFEIESSGERKYLAQYVIICTGVEYIQPNVKGELTDLVDLQNVVASDFGDNVESFPCAHKNVVVLGDSLQACESAIVLQERFASKKISIVTNGKDVDLSGEIESLIQKYKIDIVTSPISDINVSESTIISIQLEDGVQLDTEVVYLMLGYRCHYDFLKNFSLEKDEFGFIKTLEKGKTQVEGLYFAGDLLCKEKKQVFTAFDRAVDSADHINAKIRGQRRTQALTKWKRN